MISRMITTLLFSTLLSACNVLMHGTNTGNPDMQHASPVYGYSGVSYLGYSICERIKTCYPNANVTTCFNQIKDYSGFISELGSTASAYSTLTALAVAEIDGSVTRNNANFDNCGQTIRTLSCLDSLIQNAYTNNDSSNYSGTNILFRSSNTCAHIY